MLKRTGSHFSPGNNEYFGCQISWTHFIFSLAALRFNMKYYETNKFDISTILQLEYWLENSMKSYDKTGAIQLGKFIDGGIYAGNEFLYQFMRSINAEYFLLGGGKKAFRKLHELFHKPLYFKQVADDLKFGALVTPFFSRLGL